MDWKECLSGKLVKKKSFDKALIGSLIRESEKKLKTNEFIPLNEITASTKLCIVYDALREILEAVAVKKGYKIYNHECYVGFLDEILLLKESSLNFDKFRKVRNSINYNARQIDIDDVKNLMLEILNLRRRLLRMLSEY